MHVSHFSTNSKSKPKLSMQILTKIKISNKKKLTKRSKPAILILVYGCVLSGRHQGGGGGSQAIHCNDNDDDVSERDRKVECER